MNAAAISIAFPDSSIDTHGYTVIDMHSYQQEKELHSDDSSDSNDTAQDLRAEYVNYNDMVIVASVMFQDGRIELFASSWIYNGTGWYYDMEKTEWDYNMCYDYSILSRINARKHI
ncbi:MAG: hypothetical protein WC013_00975 [Aeromonas bestiarum]